MPTRIRYNKSISQEAWATIGDVDERKMKARCVGFVVIEVIGGKIKTSGMYTEVLKCFNKCEALQLE